jgi:glutamyl-tRNA reductase
MDETQRTDFSQKLMELGAKGVLIISTCNRTEIYTVGGSAKTIFNLLAYHSGKGTEYLSERANLLTGNDAIMHLFRVGAGLESQIPGDFEIIGQIKKAYEESKNNDTNHPVLTRLVDNIIRASKRVKSETEFSSGITSTSFAVVHYLRHIYQKGDSDKILIYGAGKIGRVVCENLTKFFDPKKITIVNRTYENALSIAGKTDVNIAPIENLENELASHNVLVVATGANEYTISQNNFTQNFPKLIIDLSVPRNVDPALSSTTELIDVDDLSKITSASIQNRLSEIPKVESIVQETYVEFLEWLDNRKFVPLMHQLQEVLSEINDQESRVFSKKKSLEDDKMFHEFGEQLIKKISKKFIRELREETNKDEAYLWFSKVLGNKVA